MMLEPRSRAHDSFCWALRTGQFCQARLLARVQEGMQGQPLQSGEVQALFTSFDINHDGVLQREEAMPLCREAVSLILGKMRHDLEEKKKSLSQKPRQSELQSVAQLGDVLLKLTDSAEERESLARAIFTKADSNHNGELDRAEFVRVLAQLGEGTLL
ncbi:hypothetical protein PAPYR_21 [Paratrimastix pyriformis]|uniref:EF-hand domain-containing protein n=1 Tax=Paratrimastix pyriformis TaxID=342808 RepID=A0ABQ8UZ43_9EUKA|nr:hypothetical protein PAPYR_21 [Paratrimastix pyriformis]